MAQPANVNSTGKSADRVLVVDSEPLILKVYATQLSRFYALDTSSSGAEALYLMQERGPYAVLVTDMHLPDMDGGQFLAKVRQLHNDTVRVLLTASTRQDVVAKAINEGGIFQFLAKPCTSERLAKTIENAIERYHRTLIERHFMTGALNAAIQIQLDFLEMMNPKALEKSRRVEKVVRYLVDQLSPPNGWMINLAARLSLVGEAVPREQARSLTAPELGAKLLGRLSQLRDIVEIIRTQRDAAPTDKEVPMGKRLLPLSLKYDDLVEQGIDPVTAVAQLKEQAVSTDEKIIEVLSQFVYQQTGLGGKPSSEAIPAPVDAFPASMPMVSA